MWWKGASCCGRYIEFKSLYFFLYAALGVLIPFLPVFFETIKLDESQIGILSMIPTLCSFIISPLWNLLSDSFHWHDEIILTTLILNTAGTLAMLRFFTFESQIIVMLITSIFRAPQTSFVDSLVISSLPDMTAYGSLRLWGAISFGISSLLGGFLLSSSTDESGNTVDAENTAVVQFKYLFILYGLFQVCTGFLLLRIMIGRVRNPSSHGTVARESNNRECHPWEVDASLYGVGSGTYIDPDTRGSDCDSTPSTRQGNSGGDSNKNVNTKNGSMPAILKALRTMASQQPTLPIFMVVTFLSGVGSGVIDSFLFIRLKQLGASGFVLGLSRFITCVAEIPMFQLVGWMQVKLGTWPLLCITQIAYVLRFSYYSLLINPLYVLPCETLHGFTFAVMWSVVCNHTREIAPSDAYYTMQAMVEGLHWGLGCAVGSLVGGWVLSFYGARSLFQCCAIMSLLSSALASLPFMQPTRFAASLTLAVRDPVPWDSGSDTTVSITSPLWKSDLVTH